MNLLQTNISYLTGVGPKRSEQLERDISVRTYEDLLQYYPFRYVDRSKVYAIADLHPNMPHVQIVGVLRRMRELGQGRTKRLEAQFCDRTGSIDLVWFKGIQFIQRKLVEGKEYVVFAKPNRYQASLQMAHPEVEPIEKLPELKAGLMPVYYTSERMKTMGLATRQLSELMAKLLQIVEGKLSETLPRYIIDQLRLMPYPLAMRCVHFPSNMKELEAARYRLKFDELFYLQLRMLRSKLDRKQRFRGIVFDRVGELFKSYYDEHLHFELTAAQKRVIREIRQDTLTGHQMNRLLQGDVGSGKTLVALFAMLLALDNNCQACMMAPTEILARQHHKSLSDALAPLGIEVGLHIGSNTKREREQVLPRLADGSLRIVVGTHALIEEGVQFAHLGMAIIDEQHRFGVQQRARLWEKNSATLPHILIMSATPIPRTLAMTLYGDLDISVIDELPPGRKPIETLHQYEDEMGPVYQFMRQEIEIGRQVYVVYPMIEDSERSDLQNLERGYEQMLEIFPNYELALVHGKMKPRDKDARMQAFVEGRAKILLATTVIEVGVNVPNASVMIIQNAERFGLSQLHQLRGRVGRGAEQSYCVLVSGRELGENSRRRIDVMVETNDGFEIAEEDMRLRGFGDIEGTQQSGQFVMLRIAHPARDSQLVQYCRDLAERTLSADPNLSKEENRVLRERLEYLYPKDENWGLIS